MLATPCFVSGIPQNLAVDLTGLRFPGDNRVWSLNALWPGTFPQGWSVPTLMFNDTDSDMWGVVVSWIRATGIGGCREYVRLQLDPSFPPPFNVYFNALLPWTTPQHVPSDFQIDYADDFGNRIRGGGRIWF